MTPAPNSETDLRQPSGVTGRSIVLALLLIPPNAYWSIHRGLIWGGPPATLSLFYNVVFTLFVLILLNKVIQIIFPQQALRPAEFVTVYTMLSLATAVGGFDTIQVLIQVLGHPFWFATPENEWRQLFWHHLPRWLTVDDMVVLEGYYRGESSFYTLTHIKGWARPVLGWTAFLTTMGFVMVCLNSLFRKQWTEHEKLTYPIIQLPIGMIKPSDSGLFRSRILWLGFGIAGGLNMINSLHYIFPAVPEIAFYAEITNLFDQKPWNAIGRVRLRLFPFAIGLAFFIPLDLSFSCWFFFLFWKGQNVLGSIAGWKSLPNFPYEEAQSSGSYLCIGALTLWMSKSHLKSMVKSIFFRNYGIDSAEPMPYPIAVIGLIGGMSLLVILSYQAGMLIWMAVLFFGIFFLLSITVTRMRAELGHPAHELYWRGPDAIMLTSLGPKRLGMPTLSVISLFWGFTRAQRGHMMPHQLEGFKLASGTSFQPTGRLIWAMMLAIIVGAVVSFWILLDSSYRMGALRSRWGGESLQRLENWISHPTGTDIPGTVFMMIGFLLTLVLMIMRLRWIWLPFHPVAYPFGNSFTLKWLWFSFFISWLAKWLILKHGGLGMFRRFTPLFLGLILGEFVIGGGWTIIGLIMQIPVYVFWH